ncbi:UNVERIFIED_CONTAM: hypothetical protein FKN15_047224 [Acipenser sinensis]
MSIEGLQLCVPRTILSSPLYMTHPAHLLLPAEPLGDPQTPNLLIEKRSL